LNPDVVADMSSIEVHELGPDRVQIRGAKGFVPTPTLKVSLTYEGGYRNAMTIGLTGNHLDRKQAWIKRQVVAAFAGGPAFDELRWALLGPADPHGTFEEATAWLVLTVTSTDRSVVDRKAFSDRIVEIATSSVPGFYMTTPPQSARLFGVQWPTLIDKSAVHAHLQLDDGPPREVPWLIEGVPAESYPVAERSRPAAPSRADVDGPKIDVPLGELFGTRSGDKAGAVNIGVWARDTRTFDWLSGYLTVDRLRLLMPELNGVRVECHQFSNLMGLNFMLFEYLGQGVSASTRIDPQGKGMGEYLASRIVAVPAELLGDPAAVRPRSLAAQA
jgi:hypothetical protein